MHHELGLGVLGASEGGAARVLAALLEARDLVLKDANHLVGEGGDPDEIEVDAEIVLKQFGNLTGNEWKRERDDRKTGGDERKRLAAEEPSGAAGSTWYA